MGDVRDGAADQIIADFGGLYVSDSRVQEERQGELRSALLHEVNAVGTHRVHYPWLMLVALILLLFGFNVDEFVVRAGAVLGSVVAAVAYFATREVSLTIYAGAMSLSATLKGNSISEAKVFIAVLEGAKIAWEAKHRAT